MPETNDTEWPPDLDALVAAPANHRLLLEDDTVRVLEVTVEPGERENLHHHRWPSIMVVLARPNFRNFDADGNEIPPSGGTPASCLVPESRGASLTREGEDALWQQVFMVQPVRRRAFDPSSKRRKKRPGPWPPSIA